MQNPFKLLMIGAMYENGGNTTHRFLDGHPEMFVYPFESQLGTKLVNDGLSSQFPLKYRWPQFALDGTAFQDYKLIIDEECKVRSRTPFVSKFRESQFEFSDDHRCELYISHINKLGRSRANNMEAFFRSTFEAWKDYNKSGQESFYVGYSPVLAIDAEKILNDLPNAHFLHVVRNPWSAFADTKKRPVPLALRDYMLGWNLNQYCALLAKKRFPERMHIVRAEDVMADSFTTLGSICEKMGLQKSPTLKNITWNGKKMDQVYPWGTIRTPTTEANLNTARELSKTEITEIKEMTWQFLPEFGYEQILQKI